MGGKPWQSTGCENCKKRKVKVGVYPLDYVISMLMTTQCDKQEPECERCMKRGIQCPGYDQYRIFLHNTSTTQPEEKKNKKPTSSKQTFATQARTQTQPGYLTRARPVTIQQPTTVHNGPSKREQLFSVYVNTYFPGNVSGSTALDPWYSLLSGVSALPNKPIMLEKAVAAKACIFLGRANHDDSMFYHGLQLYNSAIHHMSLHLRRKRNIYTDELVYTIAVFHQLVLQSLSPLQAKEAIDPVAHEFHSSLMSIEDKSVDEMLQLMSEISPLITALTMVDGSDHDACKIFLYDCIMHRQKLFDWYESSINLLGGRPSICETIITKLPPSTHLFGTPYIFHSLDNARVHTIYWAALSILQTLMGQAESYLNCLSPVEAATNEETLLAEFYADEISRSLPYCLADNMKSWGGHAAIFPLSQSCKFYMEFKRRDKYIFSQQAMQLLGDLGSDFAKRVSEMLWYGWSLIESADQRTTASLSPVEEISPLAEHVAITKVPDLEYITPESI
ncbi:uncharacterized protein N7484_001542 [Penicillium longicatenatum]|uniref:uncharacterized protein n=1 Tax=Penicillium longicatenatum TaxID=1561947 RepID=UPI002547607B|nr:uncharacterized protein N7484_001542 [Penicillium longicatenatum]KAJ5657893.1 hypothetical protein N7484_001542 [Penicillium longicatenatum]